MKELVAGIPDEQYGCAVTNRFGHLLDDETDPSDILNAAKVEKTAKEKERGAKENYHDENGKKGDSKGQTKCFPAVGDGQAQVCLARGEVEERVERRGTLERKHYGDTPLSFSVERPVDDVLDRAGRGRGTGRVRGARGPGYPRSSDGFDQRGKREFERHSGSDRTSVRSEEKRGGSGSRNWGSMRDHISEIKEATPSEEVGETDETPETEEADGENRPSETENAIEVAIEMTLDEWKALQEQSRPKAELNIRKPDSAMPSKAVVIHKSKFLEKQHDVIDDEDVGFRRPANDITRQLEINFGSLTRPSRGGRGGRGRVAPSMPSQRSPPQNMK